jgi:hypothetical protein
MTNDKHAIRIDICRLGLTVSFLAIFFFFSFGGGKEKGNSDEFPLMLAVPATGRGFIFLLSDSPMQSKRLEPPFIDKTCIARQMVNFVPPK